MQVAVGSIGAAITSSKLSAAALLRQHVRVARFDQTYHFCSILVDTDMWFVHFAAFVRAIKNSNSLLQ